VIAASAGQREVFPVRLHANGVEVWFLWESSDAGDFFWANDDGVLVAYDCLVMISKLDLSSEAVKVGDQSYFDLDGALRALRETSSIDPELMIDIWNVLTDLFRTISGGKERFHSDFSDTYDSYFSRCEVAGFVGIRPDDLSSKDVKNAIKVLEDGLAMIGGVVG